MMRKWLISPEYSELEYSVPLAKEYGAAFEYNDFYEPAVYDDADEVNQTGFLTDTQREALEEVFSYEYVCDEERIPFFTEEEKENLLIQKGTLTEKERKIMESHVEMTERILNKVKFNSNYAKAPKWAIQHHECLNGKGYPRGLIAEDLELKV